ncbi:MAG: CTP synthase [Patescibacteria group bacterium]
MAKYIFITGGVCSGLGKGIAASSIGMLLKFAGFKVGVQKLDPYLNVDPGTMSPYQHGEVFVTADGAETDLDLGHYERFIDVELTALSSISSGRIYNDVLQKERRGDYLGGTIQVVPHITDTIKQLIRDGAKSLEADIMICEIGGTVGDIEGEPYLEAARQMHREEGQENVLFIHLVLLPYLKGAKELKTKPAQASIRDLRRSGIAPDIILCRADEKIDKEHLKKISLFGDVSEEAVIPAPTVDSIYEVPLNFESYNITDFICNHLNLKCKKSNLIEWKNFVQAIHSDLKEVNIALVGKYTGLEDAYLSVVEAVKAASYKNKARANILWIDSERLEDEKESDKEWMKFKKADGVIVMGGFGVRGVEGKIAATKYARENKVPYLGICLGMQIAVIEFSRNILNLKDANSLEFDENTKNPVIHLMESQKNIHKKGGTMRVGNYKCVIKKGSKSSKAYGEDNILERHRHRYEFNPKYKEEMESAGLKIVGVNPESGLCEIVELDGHPWFVGVQFHPEFKSRPLRPHPLFDGLIKAAIKKM